MDTSDFYEMVDGAGRNDTAYVSIDRLSITKDFLEALCRESQEIGEMTVTNIIAMMDDAL